MKRMNVLLGIIMVMSVAAGYGSAFCADACECDLNKDGKCDMRDWLLFGGQWGHTDCVSSANPAGIQCPCDLNHDGRCDMRDWLLFGRNWGRTDCPLPGFWTWVSGDSALDRLGIYGTKGVAADTNKPGGRNYGTGWTDPGGNLWLFGGYGYGERDLGNLGDLWKFDGTSWTWVSGDSTVNQVGVYGTKGVVAPTNKPGGRSGSVSWTDANGNLWLFGGSGYDGAGHIGNLDDLWRFDGANWAWISGDTLYNQVGVYGTKGVAAPANKPGGRSGSVSWTDASGNFWLFGGYGYAGSGNAAYLNDLWKYDGTSWAWVSGDSTRNPSGVYGTKGVAAHTNKPGGRSGSVGWTDAGDNLWLFGGYGYDAAGAFGKHNDLWRFDGTDWTWISGDNAVGQSGAYGTKGAAAASNKPGSRSVCVNWKDADGNFWLFGGAGLDATGNDSCLNDLWKFDGTNWTWVSGDNTINQVGVYGTKGITADTNKPGSRYGSVGWTDASGSFLLLGGYGYGDPAVYGRFNDLWRFEP